MSDTILKEKLRCATCRKELSTGDFGYYCSNPQCPEYDVDILAYEDDFCEIPA